MKVYENEKLNFPTVVALGFFDGVHLGHRALVDKANHIATQTGTTSVVYTFDSHPAELFGNKVQYITTKQEKTFLFEKTGIESLYFQTIDKTFLTMSGEEFFKKIIIGMLNASHVIVGKNYTFGKNKSGTSEDIQRLCNHYNIGCDVISPVCTESGIAISSSAVRERILCGDMNSAAQMLGHRFFIKNTIIHGRADGRKMGFPTINIFCEENKIMPSFGVYATSVVIGGKKYKGVTNIGCAPTFGNNPVTVETNILNFDGDVYGENPTVEFLTKIRDEKKFSSVSELTSQIELDINFRNKLEI